MPERSIISIVDDDHSVREAMVSLMRSHGFAAEAFDSAESFLDSQRRGGTDCLIVDMHMSGMTGLELQRRLVTSGESIPTILITARHDEQLRDRALREGVFFYLKKPFGEDEILSCIRSALTGDGAHWGDA